MMSLGVAPFFGTDATLRPWMQVLWMLQAFHTSGGVFSDANVADYNDRKNRRERSPYRGGE